MAKLTELIATPRASATLVPHERLDFESVRSDHPERIARRMHEGLGASAWGDEVEPVVAARRSGCSARPRAGRPHTAPVADGIAAGRDPATPSTKQDSRFLEHETGLEPATTTLATCRLG